MADEADRADARIELELRLAREALARRPPPERYSGRCLWCDARTGSGWRWCDADCRDDWQRHEGAQT